MRYFLQALLAATEDLETTIPIIRMAKNEEDTANKIALQKGLSQSVARQICQLSLSELTEPNPEDLKRAIASL